MSKFGSTLINGNRVDFKNSVAIENKSSKSIYSYIAKVWGNPNGSTVYFDFNESYGNMNSENCELYTYTYSGASNMSITVNINETGASSSFSGMISFTGNTGESYVYEGTIYPYNPDETYITIPGSDLLRLFGTTFPERKSLTVGGITNLSTQRDYTGYIVNADVNQLEANLRTTDSTLLDGMISINGSNVNTPTYENTTRIGAASSRTDIKLLLGVNGTSYIYATSATGTLGTSDVRDKADFKDIEKSLEFIKSLNPVTFVDNARSKYYKIDENGNEIFDEESYKKQTLKGHRRLVGFLAQDVYQSMKDVYNDDNYASIVDYSKHDDPNVDEDRYYMRYHQITPFLVGAIQELVDDIESLERKAENLYSDFNDFKNEVK